MRCFIKHQAAEIKLKSHLSKTFVFIKHWSIFSSIDANYFANSSLKAKPNRTEQTEPRPDTKCHLKGMIICCDECVALFKCFRRKKALRSTGFQSQWWNSETSGAEQKCESSRRVTANPITSVQYCNLMFKIWIRVNLYNTLWTSVVLVTNSLFFLFIHTSTLSWCLNMHIIY